MFCNFGVQNLCYLDKLVYIWLNEYSGLQICIYDNPHFSKTNVYNHL